MLAKSGGPEKIVHYIRKNPVKISIEALKIYKEKSLYILLRPKEGTS
jgi:hypothetical protein